MRSEDRDLVFIGFVHLREFCTELVFGDFPVPTRPASMRIGFHSIISCKIYHGFCPGNSWQGLPREVSFAVLYKPLAVARALILKLSPRPQERNWICTSLKDSTPEIRHLADSILRNLQSPVEMLLSNCQQLQISIHKDANLLARVLAPKERVANKLSSSQRNRLHFGEDSESPDPAGSQWL